jgi:hypothetical protein
MSRRSAASAHAAGASRKDTGTVCGPNGVSLREGDWDRYVGAGNRDRLCPSTAAVRGLAG